MRVDDAERLILRELRECETRSIELSGISQMYGELLQLQDAARSGIVPVDLSPATTDERLRRGASLLAFDDLSRHWDQIQGLFRRITSWAVPTAEGTTVEAHGLGGIADDVPALRKAAASWYAGRSLASLAGAARVEEELLASVMGATFKPFLQAYSSFVLSRVDQELWRRRLCPICGGVPDFSFLDKAAGARWLVCSRCDAQWLFDRLRCPFCGTGDHRVLAYFTDGKALYRLYTCDGCRSYIKAVDLRQAPAEAFSPLERLLTTGLDRQAERAGYKAPRRPCDASAQ